MSVRTCKPLLNVANMEASLGFWRNPDGFEIAFTGPIEAAPAN
jgi:hypothetical protein